MAAPLAGRTLGLGRRPARTETRCCRAGHPRAGRRDGCRGRALEPPVLGLPRHRCAAQGIAAGVGHRRAEPPGEPAARAVDGHHRRRQPVPRVHAVLAREPRAAGAFAAARVRSDLRGCHVRQPRRLEPAAHPPRLGRRSARGVDTGRGGSSCPTRRLRHRGSAAVPPARRTGRRRDQPPEPAPAVR